MAMKKGYCTNCNKHDESRRIFDVNSDVRFCYCPHCGKKYRPRVVIANYERVINHYLAKANFYLKNAGETRLAYNLFAYVLELEPGNRSARLGRLLSLCYLSNLRRTRFKETIELLSIEKEDFHIQSVKKEYADFLLSLSQCSDVFLKRSKRKLQFRHYFYDVDCSKMHFVHIQEVLELKRAIIEELSIINDEKHSSIVNDSVKELEKEFTEPFYTVDGQEHRLVNFAKSGDPLIVNGKNIEDTSRYRKYKMHSLDMENKKARYIDDDVFSKANRHMYKLFRVSLMILIVFLLITSALVAFYIAFIKKDFKNIFLFAALGTTIVAIFFGVLRFIYYRKIKKAGL